MLVGLNKNVQNRLVGSAEGAFKSLFSLILPFNVILGAWDGYQNERSPEFVQDLSERNLWAEKRTMLQNFLVILFF